MLGTTVAKVLFFNSGKRRLPTLCVRLRPTSLSTTAWIQPNKAAPPFPARIYQFLTIANNGRKHFKKETAADASR